MPLTRRNFVRNAVVLPALLMESTSLFSMFNTRPQNNIQRVRPGDPLWPSAAQWEELKNAVGGRLIPLQSPFTICSHDAVKCKEVFDKLKNPYAIGDDPALTQTLGWLGAWQTEASAYAVQANQTSDVVAAVNFARAHNLRLVIKGGGHSYQGTSNCKDSLLIWTRAMNDIVINESFKPQNSPASTPSQAAVTVGAGAVWMQVYHKVTTDAGWYVQGGGCATVGVAGLIQSGGFGSLSKNYGLACAGLLEAEVVTADGTVLIVNEYNHPDLFWALKGGGGGSMGVVTRVTLRLRKLTDHVGGVFGSVQANSDEAYLQLLQFLLPFYRKHLFNQHWGEQMRFHGNNSVSITMIFQGISEAVVKKTWSSLQSFIDGHPGKYSWKEPLVIHELPPRHLWDPAFFDKVAPQMIGKDERPGAPASHFFWKGDQEEAGQYLYGYHSAWMPAGLLKNTNRLAKALFKASRSWTVAFHFNKGLAGAPEEEIRAARNTAMNPAVTEAFALAIIAGGSQPALPGLKGHEPDMINATEYARRIDNAAGDLFQLSSKTGSYVSESNFFEKNWQHSFWGRNYKRLSEVKKKYDPDGLFFVHHGVGSEDWSADGFIRESGDREGGK